MKSIKFQDKASIGDVRDTKDGYLIAMSRVARTGVQDYLASELGFVGNHIVRVNRSEDQVFSKDAMTSLSHAPVTVDHPAEMVDAASWRDLAVGEVGAEVMRDGEWLSVPLIVKDAAGIEAARSTHKEISMGYSANIVDAPDGADYDYDMREITFNHLALVPKGRAGSEARIGDAHNWGAAPQLKKDHVVNMKAIVVGDEAVQVPADVADKITAILADHKAQIDAKDKVIETRDETIGELKAENATTAAKVLTDEQIEAMVADRMAVVDKASSLVADLDVAGKTVADIKREAVQSVYGDDAAGADVTDAEINGIFRVMTPKKVDDSARKVLSKPQETKDADAQIADAIHNRFNKEAK